MSISKISDKGNTSFRVGRHTGIVMLSRQHRRFGLFEVASPPLLGYVFLYILVTSYRHLAGSRRSGRSQGLLGRETHKGSEVLSSSIRRGVHSRSYTSWSCMEVSPQYPTHDPEDGVLYSCPQWIRLSKTSYSIFHI